VFWAALSHRVYRHTLPYRVLHQIFGEDNHARIPAIATLLRKAYSIVAFALVGLVTDRALAPRTRRVLRSALVVALFSAVIEVFQKVTGATEGLLSNGIDVACGAIGGGIGAWASCRLRRRRSR
jgi:hypothetical protein